MSPQFVNVATTEQKIAKIDEFIKEIAKTGSLGYSNGAIEYFKLIVKVKSFLKVSFEDHEYKIKECIFNLSLLEKTPDKETGFLGFLFNLKIHLEAYRDEILLNEDVNKLDSKFENVEEKIKKKQLEAKRRKAVVETKEYGSYIEVFDSFRKELKRKDEQIIELITEVKLLKTKNIPQTDITMNRETANEIVKKAVIEANITSDDVIQIHKEHRQEQFRKSLDNIINKRKKKGKKK